MRQEYERKFRSVKALLIEYATASSMLRDVDLSAAAAATALALAEDTTEQRAAKNEAESLPEAHVSEEKVDVHKITDAAATVTAESATGIDSGRQKQLEKMVKALYTRLEKVRSITDDTTSSETLRITTQNVCCWYRVISRLQRS